MGCGLGGYSQRWAQQRLMRGGVCLPVGEGRPLKVVRPCLEGHIGVAGGRTGNETEDDEGVHHVLAAAGGWISGSSSRWEEGTRP